MRRIDGNTRKRIQATLWTILILVLCFMPTRGIAPEGEASFLKIPHLDKVVHLSLFLGFALLWRRAGLGILATAAAGLILAAGTEYVQGLPMIGRDCDLEDGAADFAGVLIGLALSTAWSRPRRPESNE